MLKLLIHLYIRFCGRPGKLKRARRKAKKLHAKDGKRYRVFFFGYRYHVWDRAHVRERIKSGLFKHDRKAGKDFDAICFFDTNTLNPSPCTSK